MWNPRWKGRDHLFGKQEWEGSALELFKGLQTLLITLKVVFLKALWKVLLSLKALLQIHFEAKKTKCKTFYTHHRASTILLYHPPASERPIHQRLMFYCQAHQLGTCCAHSLTTSTQALPRSRNPSEGKCIVTYLNFDRQGLSSDLFGYSSASYLPFSVIRPQHAVSCTAEDSLVFNAK